MLIEYIDNVDELAVWQLLRDSGKYFTNLSLSMEDITHMGLIQEAWEYDKGRRTKRDYKLNDETVVISHKYKYEMLSGTNEVLSFNSYIEYYDLSGGTGMVKYIEKRLSRKYIGEFNRIVRENQIDYLMAAGEGYRLRADTFSEPLKSQLLAFADIVDSLWIRYSSEIETYIGTGDNTELVSRIENEDDPNILMLFSVNDPDSGNSIKDVILYEIT